MNKLIQNTLTCLALFIALEQAQAFCGFYIAKADAKLFNNKSEVIMVRNGTKNVITMSSDFQGNLKDFAMVVPVPVILKEADIRVVERNSFDMLNDYSAPRMVEYYDTNPCGYDAYLEEDSRNWTLDAVATSKVMTCSDNTSLGVTIEAEYHVDEYDILILSATESEGLKTWLLANGYSIPTKAEEVLEPYIKSNMKFFVVKVNLEEQQRLGNQILRPIQISFNSPKFMLPIRLGMANGEGNQDMIIYAFSQKGRVETTNYRTVQMPTDRNVPTFVKDYFGQFYTSLYKENIRKEGYNNVYLEYAWDLSGQNQVKCDPCPSAPPLYAEIAESGVNWLQTNRGNGYTGQLYFTRLHVTYNRNDFPQDLVFQETSNRAQFQCRYILNHPAQYVENCSEWANYQEEKIQSRRKELRELASLTGWDVRRYRDYPNYFQGYRAPQPPDQRTGWIEEPTIPNNKLISPKQKIMSTSPENIETSQIDPLEISDSITAISQAAFIIDEEKDKKGEETKIPFAMIALTAITGLFLIHRIKS